MKCGCPISTKQGRRIDFSLDLVGRFTPPLERHTIGTTDDPCMAASEQVHWAISSSPRMLGLLRAGPEQALVLDRTCYWQPVEVAVQTP